jgi:transposase
LVIEVREQGYTGSFSHLERLFRKWRSAGVAAVQASVEEPDHSDIATMTAMPRVSPVAASILGMKPRGQLTPEEAERVNRLKLSMPNIAVMRGLAMRFRGILHSTAPSKLDDWLNDPRATGPYGIGRFAQILRRDIDAVRNAVSQWWSNGQTEGQISKLKTLKRSMYGRAGIELLRARMLPL